MGKGNIKVRRRSGANCIRPATIAITQMPFFSITHLKGFPLARKCPPSFVIKYICSRFFIFDDSSRYEFMTD
jgi:hypothetical protein